MKRRHTCRVLVAGKLLERLRAGREVGEALHPVVDDHAVEVVDLVLEDTGLESPRLDEDVLAPDGESGNHRPGPPSIDMPDTSCPIVRLDPGTPARARSRTRQWQELPGTGAVQDTEAAGTARAGDRIGQGSARPASGTSCFPGHQDNRPQRL